MIILFFVQLFIFTSLHCMEQKPNPAKQVLEWHDFDKQAAEWHDFEWKDDQEEVKVQTDNNEPKPTLEELCKKLALLKLHPNYDMEGTMILDLSRGGKTGKWSDIEGALKREIILNKARIGKKRVEELLNNQELQELITIKSLDLSCNLFTKVPSDISQLTTLTELNLTSNKFTSLHSAIGFLTNLKKLYLGDNELRNVPVSIGNLIQLKELDLRENKQLESLPVVTTRLTSLVQLKGLGETSQLPQFSSLPANLEDLPHLDPWSEEDIRYRRRHLVSIK